VTDNVVVLLTVNKDLNTCFCCNYLKI